MYSRRDFQASSKVNSKRWITPSRITVEEGRILCEVGVRLHTRAQRNEAFPFTKDLYSTNTTCEGKYGVFSLPRALKCGNGNVSLNHTLSLEEAGIRPNAQVVDVTLLPGSYALEEEAGKYRVTGRCRAHVILADEGDYSAQEFELPFRYESEGEAFGVSDYDVRVSTVSCRARVDGERIAIDAELSVALAVCGERRVEMLTEVAFGEPLAKNGATYTVCYPSADDTLWSVAKRYHRAINTVLESNSLAGSPVADSPDSLAGVKYLLV